MSNETFIISMNQLDCPHPLLHQDLQLDLTSDDRCTEFISLSPDSAQNCTSSSEREATVSSDVNMQACSLSKDSHVESIHSNSSLLHNLLCSGNTNLNQTFLPTPVGGSLHCWIANPTPMCNRETGLEIKIAFDKNLDNGKNGNAMSPDSPRGESPTSLFEASHRGSTDNGGCSLSSEEMIIRSNSFCLEDQSPLVVSSLEDSPMCLAAGCQALAAQLSEGEKSSGIFCEEKTSHQRLGVTFTQADLSTVENKMATESLIELPSEKEGLFMTFVCEPSPEGLRKEAQFPSESEVFFFTSVTPEQGKAVLPASSIVERTIDYNTHTSTPVQDIGNKMPSPTSLSGSPETGKAVSPIQPPVEQQQTSAASKHEVAQLPPSEGKIRKLQLKKFPKTDFSNIKSKVVTRNLPRMKAGSVSECKLPKCNADNKREGKSGGTIRISPAKTKGTTLASTTTKMINDAQMGQATSNLGLMVIAPSAHSAVDEQDKSGPEQPFQNPHTDTCASAVQCRNASSEMPHLVPCQMADAAAHDSGNETFCLSSREKSPDGSGQIDLKPTLKKHVSDKIKDKPSSALGQNKPSFFKTRIRCSSDRSSSQAPKEKKINVKLSNSFCVPTLTKRRDETALQDKPVAQAEDKKGQEKIKRGAKKISLFVSNNLSLCLR